MSNGQKDYYRQLQQVLKNKNKVVYPTLFLQRVKTETEKAAEKATGNHTK